MVDMKDIEGLPLFQGLTSEELKAAAEIVSATAYPAGRVIFEEGNSGCPCVYIVQKGKVDVAKRNKDGDLLTLSVLREGNFFGELSFIDNKPHSATITTAREDAVVLKIDRRDFDVFVERHSAIGYKILFNISHEISHLVRKLNAQFVDLAGYVFGRTKR